MRSTVEAFMGDPLSGIGSLVLLLLSGKTLVDLKWSIVPHRTSSLSQRCTQGDRDLPQSAGSL